MKDTQGKLAEAKQEGNQRANDISKIKKWASASLAFQLQTESAHLPYVSGAQKQSWLKRSIHKTLHIPQ